MSLSGIACLCVWRWTLEMNAWIILSFVCFFLGKRELEFPDGLDAPLQSPSITLQLFIYFFYTKKGYLSIKFILHIQIYLIPSVSDAVASKAITLVPWEKKTPPKVIRIGGRFNDFIKLISLQTQWVLLDPWTGGFVMIKGLISSNSKEIKLEGLSVLICCKLHFLSVCVCVCVYKLHKP